MKQVHPSRKLPPLEIMIQIYTFCHKVDVRRGIRLGVSLSGTLGALVAFKETFQVSLKFLRNIRPPPNYMQLAVPTFPV